MILNTNNDSTTCPWNHFPITCQDAEVTMFSYLSNRFLNFCISVVLIKIHIQLHMFATRYTPPWLRHSNIYTCKMQCVPCKWFVTQGLKQDYVADGLRRLTYFLLEKRMYSSTGITGVISRVCAGITCWGMGRLMFLSSWLLSNLSASKWKSLFSMK